MIGFNDWEDPDLLERTEREKTMEKHFVTFYSPGTFISESNQEPIESWDVTKAKKMAKAIVQRHNAKPYGFQFTTRTRGDKDLDSKVSKTSGMYFLGGSIETLAQVEARANKDDAILLSNMRNNGYDKIITNTNSWKITLPFGKNDVLLDWPA